MSTILQLKFLTEEGKTAQFTIDTPADHLTDLQVTEAMDTILRENVMLSTSGKLPSKKGAQFVTKMIREVSFV